MPGAMAIELQPLHPRAVASRFLEISDFGRRLRPAGEARHDPASLVQQGYRPSALLELFGTEIYLTRPRKNRAVRFFVAYVRPQHSRWLYPRIFYKDLSLVWRVASHLVANDDEFWIGKGSVARRFDGEFEHYESRESTTDLPVEIQTALEDFNHQHRRLQRDQRALFAILKNSPGGRVAPYADFTKPREKAPKIHRGRPVAWFERPGVPSSLRFAKGFEPDFRQLVEQAQSSSRLYQGPIRRFRFLSSNGKVQYLFFAAPKHVWIVPPQATNELLSSYAVRTSDVLADDDLFVPGYEYHYQEEDGDWVSQIPEGYVGPTADFDPTRADASAWLDRLPVVRRFRRWLRRRDGK